MACFIAATFIIYIFADSQNKGSDAMDEAMLGSHDAQYLEISGSERDALSRQSFVDEFTSIPIYATYYNPNEALDLYSRLDFTYLDDELKKKWNYRITQGREPGYMEIALNENAVKYFDELDLGKTVDIEIKIGGRLYPISLTVSGLYECDIDRLGYAVIDTQTQRQFIEKAGGTDTYDAYLYFDDSDNVYDRVDQIEASGIAGGRNSQKVNGYQINEVPLFLQFQFLIFFIFLVSPCSLLVASVFYINYKNDGKHYIMLRDMGAEKRQLIKIIMLQTLYIYLFSFPVGAAASSLTMKLLVDMNSVRQSNTVPFVFDMDFKSVLFLFIFCIVFLSLLMLPVVSRFVSKISQGGLSDKKDLYVTKSSGILSDGRNFCLSYSLLNTIRSRRTALKYVSVLAMFFVILMSTSFIIDVIRMDSEIDRNYGYDFLVSGDGNFGEGYWKISEATYQEIQKLPFIGELRRESVTYLNISPSSDSELLRKYNVVIHGIDTELLSEKYADYLSQGDMERLNADGNVGLLADSLDAYYKQQYNIFVSEDGKIVDKSGGDDILFDVINKLGGKVNFGTSDFSIAAIFKDYPIQHYYKSMIAFLTDMKNYSRITGDTSVQSLYIRCTDRSPEGIKNAHEALSSLEKSLRIFVTDTADKRAKSAQDMSNVNTIFKYLYGVMFLIISLTAIALASFYIESKREERDTLRSIGCERGTMTKIQLLEFNNIALSGCLLGIPVSLAIMALFLAVNNVGNYAPTELYYPVWLVLITAGIIYALLLISGWLSLRTEKQGEGRT